MYIVCIYICVCVWKPCVQNLQKMRSSVISNSATNRCDSVSSKLGRGVGLCF